MSETKGNEIMDKGKKSDSEFSNELNIVLDYNANLHPRVKEEMDRVKEFYDSRL